VNEVAIDDVREEAVVQENHVGIDFRHVTGRHENSVKVNDRLGFAVVDIPENALVVQRNAVRGVRIDLGDGDRNPVYVVTQPDFPARVEQVPQDSGYGKFLLVVS
jgi:hypothetical protein